MPGNDDERLRGLDPWLVKDLVQRERLRRYGAGMAQVCGGSGHPLG
jgi:hypothetical protein